MGREILSKNYRFLPLDPVTIFQLSFHVGTTERRAHGEGLHSASPGEDDACRHGVRWRRHRFARRCPCSVRATNERRGVPRCKADISAVRPHAKARRKTWEALEEPARREYTELRPQTGSQIELDGSS